MAATLQIFTFLLIFLSIVLVIGVPVTLASPGEWEKSKELVFGGASIWCGLVVVMGFFSTLA